MKDEYIIINKSAIQKRIEEWELELQECFKAPVGEFNSDYVSTLQQAISTAREILSQSVSLIPEIEKAYDAGQNSMQHEIIEKLRLRYQTEQVSQSTILNMEVHSEDYILNLKLGI